MRLKKKIENNFTTVHNAFLRDKTLGINARGILVTMLSLPDGWNFSIKGLAAILPDGQKRVATALKELEKHRYLIRERVYENGRVVDWNYIISDEPLLDFHFVNLVNEDVKNLDDNNRHDYQILNKLNTKESNTLSINHPISLTEKSDMMNLIKNNISYDIICTDDIRDILNEIVELMTDCCISTKPIRVGGQEMSSEIVKSRMLKLSSEHIIYVIGCMSGNHSKIKNIRAYLITALYNSYATINNYYQAEVNYDLYSE